MLAYPGALLATLLTSLASVALGLRGWVNPTAGRQRAARIAGGVCLFAGLLLAAVATEGITVLSPQHRIGFLPALGRLVTGHLGRGPSAWNVLTMLWLPVVLLGLSAPAAPWPAPVGQAPAPVSRPEPRVMLSRRARLLVLLTASLVASLALVVATWPRTLGTYQGCAVDAECVVVGPACEQVAIAGDQREGYEAAVRCRCGPCGFALAADSSAEAWRAWAGAALEQRTLCPLALGPPMSKICRTGSARCGRELGRCFLRP